MPYQGCYGQLPWPRGRGVSCCLFPFQLIMQLKSWAGDPNLSSHWRMMSSQQQQCPSQQPQQQQVKQPCQLPPVKCQEPCAPQTKDPCAPQTKNPCPPKGTVVPDEQKCPPAQQKCPPAQQKCPSAQQPKQK
ncbi:uncharacterized protein LOC141511281 isoform X1 [Macrotis lagotis]|uniref:uncharacterized protein LOC141511281 isoform X1 n=2 Tax=Macrotis lagotis TaxID=92651 RepID=UPI003D69C0B5